MENASVLKDGKTQKNVGGEWLYGERNTYTHTCSERVFRACQGAAGVPRDDFHSCQIGQNWFQKQMHRDSLELEHVYVAQPQGAEGRGGQVVDRTGAAAGPKVRDILGS